MLRETDRWASSQKLQFISYVITKMYLMVDQRSSSGQWPNREERNTRETRPVKEGDAITHSIVQFLKKVAVTLPQGCHIID